MSQATVGSPPVRPRSRFMRSAGGPARGGGACVKREARGMLWLNGAAGPRRFTAAERPPSQPRYSRSA